MEVKSSRVKEWYERVNREKKGKGIVQSKHRRLERKAGIWHRKSCAVSYFYIKDVFCNIRYLKTDTLSTICHTFPPQLEMYSNVQLNEWWRAGRYSRVGVEREMEMYLWSVCAASIISCLSSPSWTEKHQFTNFFKSQGALLIDWTPPAVIQKTAFTTVTFIFCLFHSHKKKNAADIPSLTDAAAPTF